MNDLISRQAAIDALIEWYGCEPSDIGAFEDIIDKMPSARPQAVRCKDCKHRYGSACDFADFWLKDDDYCSRGERREDGWIPCSEQLPKKYGWYQVTLKDGRVSRLYYDYKSGRWIDNVRKHMFEMYDIYSKLTHKRITEENEDVYWDNWVIAWMPMPEPWRGGEDGNQTE